MGDWIHVMGVVTRGHGVASGQANDPRYPKGTIAMQTPVFANRGVNLEPYFPGTINISIHPHQYTVRSAKYTLRDVKWTAGELTEDFSFFDCRLIWDDCRTQAGLIYYPHPETKPEHFQSPDILEIITHYIDGLQYGDSLIVAVNPTQLEISDTI